MLEVNFQPFPVLHTPRLLLRRITKEDAAAWFVQRGDARLMQYIARPVAPSIDEVYQLIEKIDKGIEDRESINWAITMPPNDILIGTVGFVRTKLEHHRAEIGYMLSADHHGQGIMTEAVEAVIEYGFTEMKLHSIEGVIDPANRRSARVLEKAGFIQEAFFKENYYFNGQFLDSAVYSLLAKSRNNTE